MNIRTPCWAGALSPELQKPYFIRLRAFLVREEQSHKGKALSMCRRNIEGLSIRHGLCSSFLKTSRRSHYCNGRWSYLPLLIEFSVPEGQLRGDVCEITAFPKYFLFLSPHYCLLPTKDVYPRKELVFQALNACPMQAVKVCTLNLNLKCLKGIFYQYCNGEWK